MYKIIHIHNDLKFIDETAIFENPVFINEVVILGKKGRYKGKYKETATYLKPSRSNINWLIEHCKDADMVVLYNLCLIKSFIANHIAADVKIAWRFFGHELYRYNIAFLQSDLTKEMLEPDEHSLTVGRKGLKNSLYSLRNLIRPKSFKLDTTYDYEFTKAMNRVDFFLWHYKQEYEYLRQSWPNLPQLINLPTFNNHLSHSNSQKNNMIILGNNKNPLNNHFDILNVLLSSKNFYKYELNIPFSYGSETNYSVKLREKVKNYKNIILSEVFLPIDEYELMFKKASAIVINSFRQTALGNIFLALQKGVKVYLNKKNIIFTILASQGLLVYSVDQLYDDLENNNICMSSEQAEHNLGIMHKLSKSNSVALFQRRIHSVLTDNS